MHIGGICHMNAECNVGKNKCECNPGFDGNGLQCFDPDGNGGPDQAELEIILTNEFFLVLENQTLPLGPSENTLFTEMEGMLNTGTACNGCNATIQTMN